MLKKHPEFQYRVEVVGNEQQPVLVVDNFIENPAWLVKYCSENIAFNRADAMYPGVRMVAPPEYFSALSTFIKPLVLEVFNLREESVKNIFSAYSMVTTPVNHLRPEQVIPHFDSNNSNDIASIFYLCDSSYGGTSLYRHRETGYEFIDINRVESYMASLREAFKQGRIKQEYVNGSNEVFERIVSYPAVFNRLIMYRCTSLHSGNINREFSFETDPAKGRLTIATFIGTHQD